MRRRLHVLNVVGLTAVWVLLWGKVTLGVVLMGLLVAVGVSLAFPLPGGRAPERLHPLHALRLVGRLLVDLVRASAGVARTAIVTGPATRSAVVRVQLRSRSELILATTASTLSIVPGSLIVELDRADGVLYLHCLGVADPAGMDRERERVLAHEARVIRAFGGPADLERLT